MKRALLIAGGTVGGLGAVLAITPPQLNSQSAMGGLSNIASASATTAAPIAQTTTTAPTATTPVATTPTATTSAATSTAPKATTVKKKKATKRKVAIAKVTHKTTTPVASTPTAAATTPAATTPTPTPVKSTPPAPAPAPVAKKVSGTFTGNVVNVNYGNVQVQITVVNGKITDAQALQAPSGRSDRYTQYALPILRSQTLAAQGSNIQGASGASYTSYGWYTSLQAALAKAGL